MGFNSGFKGLTKWLKILFVLLAVICYPNYQSILLRYFSARSEKEHENYYVACTSDINTLCVDYFNLTAGGGYNNICFSTVKVKFMLFDCGAVWHTFTSKPYFGFRHPSYFAYQSQDFRIYYYNSYCRILSYYLSIFFVL